MDEYKNDLGSLLELAREIAVKHDKSVGLFIDSDGMGFTDDTEFNMDIGFREPKEKAFLEER